MRVEIGRDSNNQPITIEANDDWSFKDFTNQKHIFEGRSTELDGITIYSSVFYQESDGQLVDVFPSDVKELTLAFCHMQNVRIPNGATLIECLTDRIAELNDRRPWILDPVTLEPLRLVNEKCELILGRSVDPADIPSERLHDGEELVSKHDFAKAFEAFEPAPSVDEKAVLESLMTRSLVIESDKDLAQIIDDEIHRLTAMQLKIQAGPK